MKSLVYIALIAFITLSGSVCLAEEKCNPNPNVIMTGVPFCKDANMESTATTDPDKIENSFHPENDTKINNPVIILNNPYYPPYNPPFRGDTQGTMPPIQQNPVDSYATPNMGMQNSPQYDPGYQNYNSGYQQPDYQLVPNSPIDNLPLQIPQGGGTYLDNTLPYLDPNTYSY